jgi:hypothetical protein
VAGQTIIASWRFVRDNTGKLVNYVYKNNVQGFPDSVIYNINYAAGSSNVSYIYGAYDFAGSPQKDSIVFTYTGGKISSYSAYGNYTQGYQQNYYSAYKYDSQGNVIEVKESDASTGTLAPINMTVYEYDDKTNPLQLGFEGYLLIRQCIFQKATVQNLFIQIIEPHLLDRPPPRTMFISIIVQISRFPAWQRIRLVAAPHR